MIAPIDIVPGEQIKNDDGFLPVDVRGRSWTASVSPPRRRDKNARNKLEHIDKIAMYPSRFCGDKAVLSVGARSTRRSLQPEATGAGMEVMKCLKPPDSGHEIRWRSAAQALAGRSI